MAARVIEPIESSTVSGPVQGSKVEWPRHRLTTGNELTNLSERSLGSDRDHDLFVEAARVFVVPSARPNERDRRAIRRPPGTDAGTQVDPTPVGQVDDLEGLREVQLVCFHRPERGVSIRSWHG